MDPRSGGRRAPDDMATLLAAEKAARARPEFKQSLRAHLMSAPPVVSAGPWRRLTASPVAMAALLVAATVLLGGLLWSADRTSTLGPTPPAPTPLAAVVPPADVVAPDTTAPMPAASPTVPATAAAPPTTVAPNRAEPTAIVAATALPSPAVPPTQALAEPAVEEPQRTPSQTAVPALTSTLAPPATPTARPDNPRPTFPAGPQTPAGPSPSPTP